MLINPPCIDISKSLRDAALSLNESGKGIVIITEGDHFSGIVTDGDLRRGLLRGLSLDSEVSKVENKNCITTLEEISNLNTVGDLIYLMDKNS